MEFRIEQRQISAEPFTARYYNIYCDDRLVAEYWHDHRGDDHGIRFLGRETTFPFRPLKEEYPLFGRTKDFLEGGGPEPLTLTRKAIDYLENELNQSEASRSDSG